MNVRMSKCQQQILALLQYRAFSHCINRNSCLFRITEGFT